MSKRKQDLDSDLESKKKQINDLKLLPLCDDMVKTIFQFMDSETIIGTCRLISKQWCDCSNEIPLHVERLNSVTHPIPFHTLPTLTSLSLSNQHHDDERNNPIPFEKISMITNLKSLKLSNSSLRDDHTVVLVANFPSLTSLDWGSNLISKLHSISNLSNLTCLNLANNRFGKTDIGSLAWHHNMKNLTILNVSRNNIGKNGVQSLVNSPRLQNLTWLNVRQCYKKAQHEAPIDFNQHLKNLNSCANDETLFNKCSDEAIKKFLEQDGTDFHVAPESIRDDKAVVLSVLKQRMYSVFKYTSPRLSYDRQVASLVIRQDPNAFLHICDVLKRDREIVLQTVERDGSLLKYVHCELCNDKEVVLCAVKQCGSALEFASDKLRSDREVVLCAVVEEGTALEFASDELKRDKTLVLCAVKQDGYALESASDELRNDKEVVLCAVKQNGSTLKYASEALQNDQEMVLLAERT